MDWPTELADNPNVYGPLRPGDERIVTDRYVIFVSPFGCVAQRFRFEAADLDEVRGEIHAHVRERGFGKLAWEWGSAGGRPVDLPERLLALGLEDDGVQVGVVLDAPPAQEAPAGVDVVRVETAEQNHASELIAATAFGATVMPAEVAPFTPDANNVIYLALVDGKPAARGSATFGEHGVTLNGGSSLPAARGRGAYRALVQARWEDAVARGTPLLVTQASPMSLPILQRLGFREVCRIRAFNDTL